jgi:hypothetical protein
MRERKLKIKAFMTASVLMLLTGLASAQANIDPLWKISSAAGAGSLTYAWFPATGDTVRGMTLNPATGNLLVCSRTAGTLVHRLNSTNGVEITPEVPAPVGGFTGGANALTKVAALSDGMIIATNLDTGDTYW